MPNETSTQVQIGPGAIADPGTPNGRPFLMSRTEWITVQTYVIDVLALPITADAFRKSLGSGAPSDLSDFTPLISAYSSMHDHCEIWQNETFPATVTLATDIANYGTTKAPVYYPPILKEADILTNDPSNAQAKQALAAILDNLSEQAKDYETKAAAVAAAVKTFADQTQADRVVLVGPDGKGGLTKVYNDKYGSTSQDVQELTKELAAQQLVLKGANDEYNHDVVVAATTPTYAWVWPVGTIAAAIVAGIYGKKATDALDRARAAQDKINQLSSKLAADANLMIAINSAEQGLSSINQALAAALPVIQKIQGIWGAIAGDLDNIVNLIETDIRQALPIIMNLGVDEAVAAWKNVAAEANDYRVYANVTMTTSQTASVVNA
jgi:Bacillus haemolytic enterotoxin (HBL)